MVIGSNQRSHSFFDDLINIEIDAKLITKVKEAKSIGVIIDEHLSWSNHIDARSKKISFCYSEALLCNNLPISLRKENSLGYFKREIGQLYGSSRLGSHTAIL